MPSALAAGSGLHRLVRIFRGSPGKAASHPAPESTDVAMGARVSRHLN